MTRTISAGGNVSRFEYDSLGRQVKVVDPAGRAQTTEYAPGGREVTAISRSDGISLMWYTFDKLGRRITTEGLDSVKEEYAYDSAGRIISTTRAGLTTKLIYDQAGQMIETIDALGNATRFKYDAAGQLVSITDPMGAITSHLYDPVGRRVKTIQPNGAVLESVFDQIGRLIESRGGPEGTMKYEYDLLGRQTASVDANGRRKTVKFDSLGRVIRATNEMGQPVIYEYNAANERVALIDANANRTVWEYNADGHQSSMTLPNGSREEYTYDASGMLVEKKTPNGEIIRYAYNDAGFPIRVDVEGDVPYIRDLYTNLLKEAAAAGLNPGPINFSSRNFSVLYTRDAQDRILTETCPQTTMRQRYNNYGQLISIKDEALNATILYEYNEQGFRKKMSFDLPANQPKLSPVHYKYNANGLLTHIWREGGEPFAYGYDKNNRLTSLSYPNGATTTYKYSPEGNLLQLFTHGVKRDTRGNIIPGEAGIGGSIIGFEYDFDPAGNFIAERWIDGELMRYDYDDAYRLTMETRIDATGAVDSRKIYTYDALGNRLTSVIDGTRETKSMFNNVNQHMRTEL